MASDTASGKADTDAGSGPTVPLGGFLRAEGDRRDIQPKAKTRSRGSAFSDLRLFLSAPMRSLTRRIVAVNLAGLAILVTSVLYLNKMRSELIQLRVESLETQGQILATAIAEMAAVAPDEPRFDAYLANAVMRQLTLNTDQRVQIYTSGRLMGDTRSYSGSRTPVETRRLPPLDGAGGLLGWIERLYSGLTRQLQKRDLPTYIETLSTGITEDSEVYAAQRGESAFGLRANSDGELIVSVAVPIRRLKAVTGVLVLSTEGGDIDRVIRAGRIEILRLFLVAAVVSILLAFVLANGIARPLRRLANAAEAAGMNQQNGMVSKRMEIPDLTARADEIGHLSGAMRRMTQALYSRIEAIESFAADVAHEIKNPLTSLRSAVDTIDLAKTESARQRLYDVIRHDVDRLDRLVTDISNASRLDAEMVREERTPFDLSALIEATVDILRSDASERGVQIETSLPPAPLLARGLEGRIAQVLSNLVVNAISFSPEGGTLTISAFRGEDGRATVTVEDQGPGVPEENLQSIFERFYTERPESEAFGQHSGLGLSISRQIVEAHGGTIHVENLYDPVARDPVGGARERRGARFVVRLPL